MKAPNVLFRGLALAALLILPVTSAQSDGDDTTGGGKAPPCDGCAFINTPHPPNPSSTINPCRTELSVTITGGAGICLGTAPECEAVLPCASTVHVQYKSACSVTLERFPGGAGPDLVVKSPYPGGTSGWVTIHGPQTELLGCGALAKMGYYRLTDATGFSVTQSYKYYCTACD